MPRDCRQLRGVCPRNRCFGGKPLRRVRSPPPAAQTHYTDAGSRARRVRPRSAGAAGARGALPAMRRRPDDTSPRRGGERRRGPPSVDVRRAFQGAGEGRPSGPPAQGQGPRRRPRPRGSRHARGARLPLQPAALRERTPSRPAGTLLPRVSRAKHVVAPRVVAIYALRRPAADPGSPMSQPRHSTRCSTIPPRHPTRRDSTDLKPTIHFLGGGATASVSIAWHAQLRILAAPGYAGRSEACRGARR
jgi:hypothetical protein